MTHCPAQFVETHFLRRGYGAEFEMELQWVCRRLPSSGSTALGPVVDIGCGNGALLSALPGTPAIGIDGNALGMILTRQRLPSARLLCAEADSLPFADESVRAITLQHVIEHIDCRVEASREWYRVLRPGGTLLILTPNANYCDPGVYEDISHTYVFDQGDLRRLLHDAGFQIVELRSLGLPWFRDYHRIPGGWRLRQWVTQRAEWFSAVPGFRWRGQTLCCVARRPLS